MNNHHQIPDDQIPDDQIQDVGLGTMGLDQNPGGIKDIPRNNLARQGKNDKSWMVRNELKIIEEAKVERQQEYEEAGRKSVLKSVTAQNVNPEGTVTNPLTTTAIGTSVPGINTGSSSMTLNDSMNTVGNNIGSSNQSAAANFGFSTTPQQLLESLLVPSEEYQLNAQAAALQNAVNHGLKDAQASRNKVSNDLAGMLDSMKLNTSADLSSLEARAKNLLQYVQSPDGFGQSQLEGFQNLQKELESYGTKLNSSNMTALPPYETNEDLVACK